MKNNLSYVGSDSVVPARSVRFSGIPNRYFCKAQADGDLHRYHNQLHGKLLAQEECTSI